jgi:hypothetical protein
MNNLFKILFVATILCVNLISEARVLFEGSEPKAAYEVKVEKDGAFRNFLKDRLFSLMAKYDSIPSEPRWNAEFNCKWNDMECLNGKGKKSVEKDRKKNNMLTR